MISIIFSLIGSLFEIRNNFPLFNNDISLKKFKFIFERTNSPDSSFKKEFCLLRIGISDPFELPTPITWRSILSLTKKDISSKQQENNEKKQIEINQNVENILNAMKESEKVNKKRKQNNFSNESGKEW